MWTQIRLLLQDAPTGAVWSGSAVFGTETFQQTTHSRWERSGSVVECFTRNREAAGSSLTGVTKLWSLSKTHLSLLSTGSTHEYPSLFN